MKNAPPKEVVKVIEMLVSDIDNRMAHAVRNFHACGDDELCGILQVVSFELGMLSLDLLDNGLESKSFQESVKLVMKLTGSSEIAKIMLKEFKRRMAKENN